MGSVPPGLLFILEYVDPDWTAPLWRDPIGWAMIGLAAILEVTAIALIRKIIAVVI
jgi:Flp pilus assembly protein TadB